MIEKKLEDLEVRLTYQEATIEELNQVIIKQQDQIDLLMRKSRILKWNVETIGFSPNGFNAYFLFKILLVAFAGLVFLHAIAFFYRSYLEYVEGPEPLN